MPFFLSCLPHMWEEYSREQSFRVYLTDAVQIAAENAAHIGGGTTISKRWADIVDERKRPEDTRDAEEIIADVIKKTGITLL